MCQAPALSSGQKGTGLNVKPECCLARRGPGWPCTITQHRWYAIPPNLHLQLFPQYLLFLHPHLVPWPLPPPPLLDPQELEEEEAE